MVIARPTPESGVSGPNGTRIVPSSFSGSRPRVPKAAKPHAPFRDCQLSAGRTSSGRGYSRQAFSAVTLSPKAVSAASRIPLVIIMSVFLSLQINLNSEIQPFYCGSSEF